MNIFRHLPSLTNSVITIGSFDGVHRGHQELISKTKEIAQKYNCDEYIISFDPHPRLILGNNDTFQLLTTTNEKIKLLEELGVKNLILLPFSTDISQLSAYQFLEKFIIQPLNPSAVIIGYDHKFGKDRQGSKDTFYNYNSTSNKPIEIIEFEEFRPDELKINSTSIRHLLLEQQVSKANELLGHSYSIEGIVVKGKQVGRTIGFPTANIEVQEPKKLIPSVGIYKSYIEIKGQKYLAATNIGYNPTIDINNKLTIESYIIDFDQDIYGEKVILYLTDYIRSEMNFTGLEALKAKIKEDIESVKNL